MIATSHVIIGGTIGVLAKDPVLGFAAGVVSHLVCDCIPHLDAPFKIELRNGQFDQPVWDKRLFIFALIDSLTAFFLTLFLWHKLFSAGGGSAFGGGFSFSSPFAWGALGAYLPDFLDNTPFWDQQLRKLPGFKQFHTLHLSTHDLWRFRFPMPDYWVLGTVSQIIVIIPCLWFLLK